MPNKWIYLHNRDEMLRLDLQKVVYFEASSNYTEAWTVNSLKAVIGMNLGKVQELLSRQTPEDMPQFMRIGKRFIVNMQYICQIHVVKQRLVLSDFEHFTFSLPVSKEALKNLKDLYQPENTSNLL